MEPRSDSCTSVSLLGRLGSSPNDGAAWTEFVRRYGPRLLLWCRQWQLQEADAQDVAQNVLLRLSRQFETFRYDPTGSFRAWLKTVAYRAWCDWQDEQRRGMVRGSGDTAILGRLCEVEARDDLVRQIEDEYDRELLEAASAQVRLRVEPRTWEAFELLTFQNFSGAEAAAQVGMKVGAVYVAKNKVQKMLREAIRRLEGEGST